MTTPEGMSECEYCGDIVPEDDITEGICAGCIADEENEEDE